MSEHDQSSSTSYTVFDYLGLGFILEPPGVVVHAMMTGEELRWAHALYAIPFIALGALFIYIGRNWATLKEKVNGRVADAVDGLSRTYLVPFLIVLFALNSVAILPLWIWPPNKASSPTANPPRPEDIAAAIVKVLPQLSKNAGMFNEAVPKPPSLPRSKQAINELLEESGHFQNVIEKVGPAIINDWRQSIATTNLESICRDTQSLQRQVNTMAGQLDSAQREVTSVYNENRIDGMEFNKIFGSTMTGIGPNGFGSAAQTLRNYGHEINLMGDRPCDAILKSNILIAFSTMVNGLNQFSTWLAQTNENLEPYRDSLRKELRKAP